VTVLLLLAVLAVCLLLAYSQGQQREDTRRAVVQRLDRICRRQA
jgi:hypothetical protein